MCKSSDDVLMGYVSAHYAEVESEACTHADMKLLTCKRSLQGEWDEHVVAGPPVWSWGTRKLAYIVLRLWLVCLDENTISLFVLCHCLKQNLGCRICWHFRDSCRVPFVRKREGGEKKKG